MDAQLDTTVVQAIEAGLAADEPTVVADLGASLDSAMAELDAHLGQLGPQVVRGQPALGGAMKGGVALLWRHSGRSGMAFQLHEGLLVPVVDQDTAAFVDRLRPASP